MSEGLMVQAVARALGCVAGIVLALGLAPAARAATTGPAPVTSFDASVSTNVAGAHPDLTISFAIDIAGGSENNLADAVIDGPAGLLGDPSATPERCTQQQLAVADCPPDSQVGVATVTVAAGQPAPWPVYNVVSRPDEAARLGFFVGGAPYPTQISIVPRSAGDFGLHSSGAQFTAGLLTHLVLTVWGVPADPSHDAQRMPCLDNGGSCPATWPAKPFLVNPTKCDGPALVTTLNADFWGDQGDFQTLTSSSAPPVGCDQLPFDPSLSITPTTTQVDEPTGLAVDVHVPQNDDPNSVATSAVRKAVVTLPPGMTLSPSAATRLQGCTDAELGLGSNAPATCPAESQIGTTEIDTPLLPSPLLGTLYLGTPLNNDPTSGQMYRIFQVASGFGMTIKLVGNTVANPETGQLTTTFDDLPQAPFSDFKLFFKGGSTAPLANPLTCQANTTTSDFTPYALNGDKLPTSSFTTSFDGNGAPCPATPPFAPSFDAGSTSTQAGASSGFRLDLTRPDGDQYLSRLSVTTPPGLAARLPAVPMCPVAQAAAGTCPAASRIGSVQALSGTGSAPLSLPGSVYLAQPSRTGDVADLSVVVPAIAGPYNLGNVVVLSHVHVDPTDAHLTVTTDPLPTILDGIPLRIHAIQLDIDHPGFMVNPTSCDPMQITGTATSTEGATAPLSSRFQVGGCAALPFSPRLKMALSGRGRTHSGDHPTLTATLTQGPGQANIHSATIALPLSLALDPNNSQHVCGYDVAQAVHGGAVGCPASTIVGSATAVTPLLAQPISGPVYLVQGIRFRRGQRIRTLPSLLVPLRGQIALDLRAQTSVPTRGAQKLVTTFSTIPDAPVSKFTLTINGGRQGILVITGRGRSICAGGQVTDASFGAQSGKAQSEDVSMGTPCGRAARVQLLSHWVGGGALIVRVRTSQRGRLTVTGRHIPRYVHELQAGTHLIRLRLRTGRHERVTVHLELTARNARAVEHSFRQRL